jgi:hypothetical protein
LFSLCWVLLNSCSRFFFMYCKSIT